MTSCSPDQQCRGATTAHEAGASGDGLLGRLANCLVTLRVPPGQSHCAEARLIEVLREGRVLHLDREIVSTAQIS
jgi:hypothetical protein